MINILQIPHNLYPIAHPYRWDIGCGVLSFTYLCMCLQKSCIFFIDFTPQLKKKLESPRKETPHSEMLPPEAGVTFVEETAQQVSEGPIVNQWLSARKT